MRNFWIIILCVLILSCNSEPPYDVQGHRGCRGLMPENSIPGFEKAIDLGVQTLELDVVISKDHKVIVSHEPYLSHLIAKDLNGSPIAEEEERSYNLYQMPYDSIVGYDCGSLGHVEFPQQKKQRVHKPLLLDVIKMAESKSSRTIQYNIEIKSKPEFDNIYSPHVDVFTQLVLEDIDLYNIEDRVTIQSFDLRALESAHKRNPDLQIALLVDEFESIDNKLSKLSFNPEIISPYFKLLDRQSVIAYQNREFKIIPWTVNEIGDINLMIDMKVDGIISDYPNTVIQLLELKQ